MTDDSGQRTSSSSTTSRLYSTRRRALGNLLAAIPLLTPLGARAEGGAVSHVIGAIPWRSMDGVALVLGGGGCRGYSHIGVLRVLERNGLRPGLIVGSSAGSLVGGLYAAGKNLDELERVGYRTSPNLLRDWVFPKLGLFGGDAIRRFVSEQVELRIIGDLPLRFTAVATDLRSGELLLFTSGDLGRAIQASCSIPGLIEPVQVDGRLCVDGNLVSPVPVDAARRLGASKVIAVDVTFPPEQARLEDPFDALYQGFSILTRRMALEERARADVLIVPGIPKNMNMSTASLRETVEAGEAAADAVLPRLRELFVGA